MVKLLCSLICTAGWRGSQGHWWPLLPGGETWERAALAAEPQTTAGSCSSGLPCCHAVAGWEDLGWVDAGHCCGGSDGFPAWSCDACALQSSGAPGPAALPDGGESLRSARDWGFGRAALVLLCCRKPLSSEMPALPPVQLLSCQKAGPVQGQGAVCPAWAQACVSCGTYMKHG